MLTHRFYYLKKIYFMSQNGGTLKKLSLNKGRRGTQGVNYPWNISLFISKQ